MRYILAAVILFFAWKGAAVNFEWPPSPLQAINVPKPDKPLLEWANPLRPYLSKMTPRDRVYLSNFYDAMAHIVMRDGDREQPIISTTEKFERFHAGSLRLAVDKGDVGKYGALGEAIDETFVNAIGADMRNLDREARLKLVTACGVLSWTFAIHGE